MIRKGLTDKVLLEQRPRVSPADIRGKHVQGGHRKHKGPEASQVEQAQRGRYGWCGDRGGEERPGLIKEGWTLLRMRV